MHKSALAVLVDPVSKNSLQLEEQAASKGEIERGVLRNARARSIRDPRYAHRQTESDIRRWCEEVNLDITYLDEQESGFTIRAIKT